MWRINKTIYLSFDDGPGKYTLSLLDILDKYGIKATFFVVNSDYNDVMTEIVNRGHSIGLHSKTHIYSQIYADPKAYFDDLYAIRDIVYEKTGVHTTLIRFPGGCSNTVSRRYCQGIMTYLAQEVQEAGFQYFDWNVDSDDAGDAETADEVIANIKRGIKRKRTSLVLQHDIKGFSVAAAEKVIPWGLNHGFIFRPLTPESPGFHHRIAN